MEKITFLKKTYKILNSDGGAECTYFQISKTVGIKMYVNKDLAELAHKKQTKAYKNKIGPKVLSAVHPVECHNFIEYGYKTQVAKVIVDEDFEYSKMGKELIKKVKKVFGAHNFCKGETVRYENAGFIGNRPVVIDFGRYSF